MGELQGASALWMEDLMARPVKETPVLEGKDARRFEEEIKRNKLRVVPREEYLRAMENYRSVKIASK